MISACDVQEGNCAILIEVQLLYKVRRYGVLISRNVNYIHYALQII